VSANLDFRAVSKVNTARLTVIDVGCILELRGHRGTTITEVMQVNGNCLSVQSFEFHCNLI